ncbi:MULTISPECIES: phosphodiester glycosidase family protein [unclassified Nostoc]|uniref:phosphodiester glycosidase family protein n=1 Tax=unclassified Nostoc TaxID=2593658 RepID=UPI002AD3BF05|nr:MULTISPECIES: phosphodiester glycosidase family protein [unclassified Nostoc]MDZ8123343.1 phosphodiester glycosidase family protein [Nostoc sp. CmiVER01]MDZ8227677.1 phosphodiester glycosidase family protein [Nostoc sp. ChiVER01]
MYTKKLFLLFILIIGATLLSGCQEIEANSAPKASKTCPGKDAKFSIDFFKTNNQGKRNQRGINNVIIFNPKSAELDFKVNVGLSHKLYAKDARGKLRKEYVPKQFRELIGDENAKLNGQLPIAAINADYIGTDDKPQGLNISRGVEYSGVFKNKRSSFGISGGTPNQRQATIQAGRRKSDILNYNLVGGNGRFYRQGKFKDICQDLGEFACKNAKNRSMAAITNQGYVILLVNDLKANSDIELSQVNQELLPDMFDNVLEGIANNNCLGKIQEAILFDGGMSPGLYYNQKTYVENLGPIGSVFLIYKK